MQVGARALQQPEASEKKQGEHQGPKTTVLRIASVARMMGKLFRKGSPKAQAKNEREIACSTGDPATSTDERLELEAANQPQEAQAGTSGMQRQL